MTISKFRSDYLKMIMNDGDNIVNKQALATLINLIYEDINEIKKTSKTWGDLKTKTWYELGHRLEE